jgi:eukaryotic-like serine/threonine-protein kinase
MSAFHQRSFRGTFNSGERIMLVDQQCPDPKALERFLLGDVGEAEAEVLEAHLLDCARCAELCGRLPADDTLSEALRTATDLVELQDEPRLARLMDRLVRLRGERSPAGEPVGSESGPDQANEPTRLAGAESATPAEAFPSPDEWDDVLSPPEAPDEIGRLAEYRVLRVLGRGGMGIVFEAEDFHLKRRVALKCIDPALARKPAITARFLREARGTAAIEHDHIVTVYQAGEAGGAPFLAMQLLRGESLASRLERSGRLPVRELLQIGRETAAGLAAAHQRGLLHRDIKPDNIWLEAISAPEEEIASAVGEPGDREVPCGPFRPSFRVKLLDFGLVAAIDQDERLTEHGQVLGTPQYMSPEQTQGEPLDGRSDLFSLGSVLYRLAGGQSAFARPNITATLVAVAEREPIPVGALNPELPESVVGLISRLLEKDPDRRIQSAEEVVREIEAIERELDSAPATTADYPMVVLPGTGVPEDDSTPRKQRRGAFRLLGSAVIAVLLVMGVVLLLRTPQGEVTVELGAGVNPEEVTLELTGDGTLQVADAASDWTIRLREGEYTVQAAGSEDRFQIDPRTVTVARGEQVRVRVSLTPAGERADPDRRRLPAAPAWQPTLQQQAFFDHVATLTPAEQVEVVREKLREANPDFDGKVQHEIEADCVVELQFHSGDVAAIWPVRALASLERLNCAANASRRSQLSDLSPLAGMPLTSLDCEFSEVSDLSPLEGSPLTRLWCYRTHISDLSPLTGMPLTELNVAETNISELSPLAGMGLTYLNCGGTNVSDLSPLAGMPLTRLECRNTNVSDLSPLKGMPLRRLGIEETPVRDLSPLRDAVSLQSFDCWGLDADADLSVVTHLPLRTVRYSFRLFHPPDEDFLHALPVESISISPWEAHWLGGHESWPIGEFWDEIKQRRSETAAFVEQVRDLPAQEQLDRVRQRLHELNPDFDGTLRPEIEEDQIVTLTLIGGNQITNITPLRALGDLRQLTIVRPRFSFYDLSPLNALPLEELTCPEHLIRINRDVLRKMEALQTINGQPAAGMLAADR